MELASKLFAENGGQIVVGFKAEDKVCDLHVELPTGVEITPLYASDSEYIHFLRHDAAHVLAQALTKLYPKIKFGKQFFKDEYVFGFDVYLPSYNLTKDDFAKIELEMSNVVKRDDEIIRHVVSKDNGLARFQSDEFKQDIISNSPADTVMLYEHGDYIDICHGPRGLSNGHVGKHFKLLEIESTEWMFDASKKLQRIIGACFRNEAEMQKFLMEYLK